MMEKFALIIVGTAAVCYGLICALRLKQSMSWNSVPGEIIKSINKTEYSEAGKQEGAEIVYEYAYREKKYTSRVIKIGGDMLSKPSRKSLTEADHLLIKYPVGKSVDVYVNPKYPKVSCLERAGAEAVFISIFIGMLAVVAGLFFEEITDIFTWA